jgi:transcriptional regulator with XRE-family HTH domain
MDKRAVDVKAGTVKGDSYDQGGPKWIAPDRRPHRRRLRPEPTAEETAEAAARAAAERNEVEARALQLVVDSGNDAAIAVGLVRRARRIADLSQRELATKAGVSRAMIGRIESGNTVPSLGVFQRIMRAAGLYLVVVDENGKLIQPMRDREDVQDGAGRRYPSHLDTILDPEPGQWWADIYGLAAPPETFYRDRAYRDAQRRLSVWQVRVKQNRNAPRPPDPKTAARYRWDPDSPDPQ